MDANALGVKVGELEQTKINLNYIEMLMVPFKPWSNIRSEAQNTQKKIRKCFPALMK